MQAPIFSRIDWTQPWYASVRVIARELAARMDMGMDLSEALNAQAVQHHLCNLDGLPLRFVPQAALPEGMAYESFIHASGQVPTRDNLHDLFNALVWFAFPRIKQQLNALQAAQIAAAGVGQERGALRDGVTIFDENAALIVVRAGCCGQGLLDALRAHQWHELFCRQSTAFGLDAEVWLFGHALMEKLAAPYKAITAHSWAVFADDAFFRLEPQVKRVWLDGQVARQLRALPLSTACFTPLPVLGVPGWEPLQDAAFYADESVFRPKRIK
jgi:hypothetical protein